MPDQTPFSAVSQATLKEIAQSLLQMRAAATSIGNSVSAFSPLTDHGETQNDLAGISQMAEGIRMQTDKLYRAIAREAAKV